MKNKPFHTLRAGIRGSGRSLFCFPFAGGSATCYQPLTNTTLPDLRLYNAVLPGRGPRFDEPIQDDLHQLVITFADMAEYLHPSQYVLFGHSMGAIFCFELARELRRRIGAVQPTAIVVSGARAPHLFARDNDKPRYSLPNNEFIAYLSKLNGTPEEVLQCSELMDLMLPSLRTDFKLCETYQFTHEPALDIPIIVLGGKADADVSIESLLAWKEHTQSKCPVSLFEGGHFYINDCWDQLGQILNASFDLRT